MKGLYAVGNEVGVSLLQRGGCAGCSDSSYSVVAKEYTVYAVGDDFISNSL